MFLGLACDKQDQNDEAERVYNTAAKIKPNDSLVWQGLITLYEKQAGKKIDHYGNAALHLAQYLMAMYVLVHGCHYRCCLRCLCLDRGGTDFLTTTGMTRNDVKLL